MSSCTTRAYLPRPLTEKANVCQRQPDDRGEHQQQGRRLIDIAENVVFGVRRCREVVAGSACGSDMIVPLTRVFQSSPGQVQGRHQEQPDGIHKVPVKAHHINRRVVLRRYLVRTCLLDEPQDAPQAHDDVDAVDAGHDVVEAEEQPHLAGVEPALLGSRLDVVFVVSHTERGDAGQNSFVEVLGVLETLHHHEGRAEREGDEQIADQLATLPQLCRANRQRHREAASHQEHGVDRGERQVQPRTGVLELGRVPQPVGRVRAEQAREEKHFRGQEHPHAQPLGGVLLVQILEVVLQHRRMSASRQLRSPSSWDRGAWCDRAWKMGRRSNRAIRAARDPSDRPQWNTRRDRTRQPAWCRS